MLNGRIRGRQPPEVAQAASAALHRATGFRAAGIREPLSQPWFAAFKLMSNPAAGVDVRGCLDLSGPATKMAKARTPTTPP